ncbi:MAG TPA: macro domain-containing protein [Longimicrobiales bacterium]
MIEIRHADLTRVAAGAVLRSVAADGSAVTPLMRRLELAAGPEVAAQCQRLGELPVGSAVITAGGALPAAYLIHVAVRSVDQPVTADGVRRALSNGLRRAVEWEIETLAVPPLGLGAGNLDAEEAAGIMIPVLVEHLRTARHPREVIVVVESDYEREAFERALAAAPV